MTFANLIHAALIFAGLTVFFLFEGRSRPASFWVVLGGVSLFLAYLGGW